MSVIKAIANHLFLKDPTAQLLESLHCDFHQREDGMFVVKGGIDLSYQDLTRLPDFSKVIVEGYFWCNDNQLSSLTGAPQTVGGSFLCDNNQLTSLTGAPQTVEGSFSCNNNQLISLAGAPRRVGWNFLCYNNQLTSLEGSPQRFNALRSDFGDFTSPSSIPEALLLSPETRARREQEERQALIDAVHAGTPEPIVLPKTKGIVWANSRPAKR